MAGLRTRPLFKSTQLMDEGARYWLFKTAKRNYWRVASWMDIDDLIQDGFLCWQITIRRHPDVEDIRILMRYFQVTYSNLLHDLANKRTYSLEVPFCTLSEEATYLFEQQVCEFGEMMRLIIEAPPQISRCLRALIFNNLDLSAPYRLWLDGRRETFNDRLCRLLGVDPKTCNLHKALDTYLRHI